MKVGFAGLGHMGAPMSGHIRAAGYEDLTGTPLRIDAPQE
jgi:3-hydroxyisobutyrate dehydrogenase-like beta-hydroxyacid dehydrogenase